MLYTIMIFETPQGFELRSDLEKSKDYWAAWPVYTKALQDAGVMTGGGGLKGPETATTVRMREGKRFVQDGPYAEVKEQLGGFVIIDVPSLDAALKWAERCPKLPGTVIEVRPNLTPHA